MIPWLGCLDDQPLLRCPWPWLGCAAVVVALTMAQTVPVATVAVSELVDTGGSGFRDGSQGHWTVRLLTTARP